jgi:hypothetical protein
VPHSLLHARPLGPPLPRPEVAVEEVRTSRGPGKQGLRSTWSTAMPGAYRQVRSSLAQSAARWQAEAICGGEARRCATLAARDQPTTRARPTIPQAPADHKSLWRHFLHRLYNRLRAAGCSPPPHTDHWPLRGPLTSVPKYSAALIRGCISRSTTVCCASPTAGGAHAEGEPVRSGTLAIGARSLGGGQPPIYRPVSRGRPGQDRAHGGPRPPEPGDRRST